MTRMLKLRDPAIKLFGKTIEVTPNQLNSDGSLDMVTEDSCCSDHDLPVCSSRPSMEGESRKGIQEEKVDLPETELNANTPKHGTSSQATEELKDSTTSSNQFENPSNPSGTVSSSAKANSNVLEDSGNSISHKNTMKKPDKILPCPRCNSMDTKFCYYNNYNVNQPRYFCRKCQRYWTSGGSMRNVPVGAGRRKSKSSCTAYYRHIVLSETPQSAAQLGAANGLYSSLSGTNGSVLSFGPDSSFNRPMALLLSQEERTQNHDQNGLNDSKRRKETKCGGTENGDDQSTGSSVTDSQELIATKEFPPLAQCFPGPVWHWPWSLTQGNAIRPSVASHTSGYPATFYQATPHWNCTLSSSSNNYPSEIGKDSPGGKINSSLNSSLQKGEVPLKDASGNARNSSAVGIDNSKATFNSSIRTALGTKAGSKSITRTGIFDAFHSNGEIHNHLAIMTPLAVIRANPAAVCRSMNFQEQM